MTKTVICSFVLEIFSFHPLLIVRHCRCTRYFLNSVYFPHQSAGLLTHKSPFLTILSTPSIISLNSSHSTDFFFFGYRILNVLIIDTLNPSFYFSVSRLNILQEYRILTCKRVIRTLYTDFHRVFKRHFSYGVQIILRGL